MSTVSTVTQFLPRSAVGRIAAGMGLCFLCYCVYFDYKRRNHPDFRKRLRESNLIYSSMYNFSMYFILKLPDPEDKEATQQFIIQEIQLGEEGITTGDIENGVDHLCNAVMVCAHPQQLLMLFQQTLPPTVFQLLIKKISISEVQQPTSVKSDDSVPTITELEEEGVE
ncbi:hypothetical protein FSP39_021168 [Pinctada imbricata]|uniref:Uncharacterized protein n=1 Tax=Pinctada imbricata TaxID=66713 RepID=A0AA89BX70_PINIB|nr:hypothetical protein FSP39_021168 [Pinctada imbricata]